MLLLIKLVIYASLTGSLSAFHYVKFMQNSVTGFPGAATRMITSGRCSEAYSTTATINQPLFRNPFATTILQAMS
jgi:hypothetical protein